MGVEGSISPESAGNSVAILDAGAQYGKVIDRRVRGHMVRSELQPIDIPLEELEEYGAIILSGGPESVYAQGAPHPDPKIWESNKPILGICYGMQLINQAYGGSVERDTGREDGPCSITIDPSSLIFHGLDRVQKVLMSHGDSVAQTAPGFNPIARSNHVIAAISDEERRIYGTQFHPEVDLTEHGQTMIENFLFRIAGLKPDYTIEDRRSEAVRYIRQAVGDRQVLTFASGGVDSTVCAALVAEALPAEQIHVVHIDTGFMRYRESEAVYEALQAAGVELEVVNASKRFFNGVTEINGKLTPPLREVTDPEMKRHIIGDTFMHVMEQVVAEMNLDPQDTVLAQGTLRPDLIESASHLASSQAAIIKTHHNDTPLVRKLRESGGVIEPLQELHKDEVRELGEQLGLPPELVWRQPFPGPGLAIRLLCAREPYRTTTFDTLTEELEAFTDQDISAHLLPVRTVGVQGDGRSYSYLAALSGRPDWNRLFEKAQAIPRQLREINRIVYILGDKIAGPINDITPTLPTPDAVEQLRQADRHINEVLRKFGLHQSLSQVPVISFPVGFDRPGEHSIGIRTFITKDFMTGVPAIPGEDMPEDALAEMVDRVLSVEGISRVVYDLTSKPPGTTEWE